MPGREFYMRGALKAAPELLGKLLVHETEDGTAAGMITEVEAYVGPEDDGAHSFGMRRTARTEIQYGPGGYAYVFGIYGMHRCFNAVFAPEGRPEVVLVRALKPVEGLELMRRRRGTEAVELLCSGPGRLCQALGIGMEQYGADLCAGPLYIRDWETVPAGRIALSPRVNIDYAEKYRDKLWRFFIKDSPFVSKVPGRYAARGTLEEMRENFY